MSEAAPTIYKQLAAIQADVSAIAKDTESRLPFNYRAADDVMVMLHSLMVKHNVVCMPRVISHELTEYTSSNNARMLHVLLSVEFEYFALDGSSVTAIALGEGADSSDKATNKAFTQARKYADCQVFTIPTWEDDPDADDPEPPGKPLPGGKKMDVPSKRKTTSSKTSTGTGHDANDGQKRMLYARSMARAEGLIAHCAENQLPLNHQDQNSCAGSIRKEAYAALGIDGEDDLKMDDVNKVKHAIDHATVDDKGDTVIPGGEI